MGRVARNLWSGVAFAAIAAVSSPIVANAQGVGDSQISVSIPAQRLSDALRQLAEASHLQLIYDTKITDGKTSAAVSGAMTSRAALTQLLAGSGLGFHFSGDQTVTISIGATGGVHAVGVVNVEGVGAAMPNGEMASAVNGVNGSSDVEATEGTGSYTTGAMSIVSKIPQSIRETPQSVSVITSQQIVDENLLGLQDVMDALPGISTTAGATNAEFEVYSRGFKVTSYAFDGGAPVSYAFGNRPVIDLSEFDSAQLIRGADGLFGGYGDPGGVVNLDRKKPLDHDQFLYNQTIGSWNNFREEVDATGPLTADGKLKGRVALAEQDQDFFYKVANSHKGSIYGTLEYDLTPTTILTVGGNYVRERNITNAGGLPRYSDGTTINWPTSTCLCEPYNYDNATRVEAFLTFTDKINRVFSTKFNFTYNKQNDSALYYGLQSTIKPGSTPATATDTNGEATALLQGYSSVNPVQSFAGDYNLTGKFNIFGLEQQFVIGGNYIYYILDGSNSVNYTTQNVPNVFDFNPSLYKLSYEYDTYAASSYNANINRQSQYGVFGNAKLEPFKNLHIYLGARFSGYNEKEAGTQFGSPFVTPTLRDVSHSNVDVAGAYDFFKYFTIYASHESIYQPQDGTRFTVGGSLPPPITGTNDETGLKWESPNKLFNASISVYSIVKNNFETTDYANPGSNIPIVEDIKSSGFDAEAAGQILPNWQINGSFTSNTSKIVTPYDVNALAAFVPRDKLKIFTTYRPLGNGIWGHMILGGGINWQSSASTTSITCVFNPTTFTFTCPAIPLVAKSFTTASLIAGYRINSHIELSLDARNITNVKTYAPIYYSSTGNYNYYTEPFNLIVSLHAKW